MIDEIHEAAQKTVDAIDRRVAELLRAKEAIIRELGFGLRVGVPTPPNPEACSKSEQQPPVVKEKSKVLRITKEDRLLELLRYLQRTGPTAVRQISQDLDVSEPTVYGWVNECLWFTKKEGLVVVTEPGAVKAAEMGIDK